MIRDPRDQYAAATTTAERRAGKVGASTARWLSSLALAERNRRRYPDYYKIVRYEALCDQREATLRDICVFLREPFVPQMLTLEGAMRFGADRDEEDETSTAPPSPLAAREAAFIERYAARQMTAMGYPSRLIHLASRDRLAYALVDWPANVARAAAWRALETLQHRTPPQIGRWMAFGSMK
jgi:hypothetical protein